ncbi:hypothetical protein ACHAXS_005753 [Conticribra weissflogii]
MSSSSTASSSPGRRRRPSPLAAAPPSSSPSHACINPAETARSQNLYLATPLVHSIPLSRLCHPHPVYLKLDLLQPSGSFKDRGMAHLVCTVRDIHRRDNDKHTDSDDDAVKNDVKFISSSGGNAGLALTTVCRSLQPPLPVSVIVPETTKAMVVSKLKTLGADVTVFGKHWNEADALARKMVQDGQTGEEASGGTAPYYVSPYDNPLLWTGHSTVVDEILDQLPKTSSSSASASARLRIGAILASVGGGGLLSGILEGLDRHRGRSDLVRGTKVVACETEGAASFAASTRSLNMKRLEGITSVATSLGALEVTPAVIRRAHRHQRRGRRDAENAGGNGDEDVLSYTCTDAEAVDACVRFAADHRMLVEPACGAALAPVYSERLRGRLLRELGEVQKSEKEEDEEDNDGDRGCRAIVVEVCGGSGVSAELLMEWKKQFLE